MSEQTRSDWVSASSWGRAGCYKYAILNVDEEEFFKFIGASLINDLSEKLIWRLSTVLFESWHVDVVDENNHFSAGWGTEEIFLFSLEFILV
jgi:hypothetical protein